MWKGINEELKCVDMWQSLKGNGNVANSKRGQQCGNVARSMYTCNIDE